MKKNRKQIVIRTIFVISITTAIGFITFFGKDEKRQPEEGQSKEEILITTEKEEEKPDTAHKIQKAQAGDRKSFRLLSCPVAPVTHRIFPKHQFHKDRCTDEDQNKCDHQAHAQGFEKHRQKRNGSSLRRRLLMCHHDHGKRDQGRIDQIGNKRFDASCQPLSRYQSQFSSQRIIDLFHRHQKANDHTDDKTDQKADQKSRQRKMSRTQISRK